LLKSKYTLGSEWQAKISLKSSLKLYFCMA